MRVRVVGASGTIGAAVVAALEPRHEVVRASRRGPVRIDLTDAVVAVPREVGELDAVISCAASAPMAPLHGSSDEEFFRGVPGKLLGQVRLVRALTPLVRDGGSITLTSGRFPARVPGSALGALVNAGLEEFVQVAALEMPRGVRLNVVSPPWVRESGGGPDGIPVADVAACYVEVLTGPASGQVLVPASR